MKLHSNTALAYNQMFITYEIFLSPTMLVFKPSFYFENDDCPCIILTRNSLGWRFMGDIDKKLKDQVMDDISYLKIN